MSAENLVKRKFPVKLNKCFRFIRQPREHHIGTINFIQEARTTVRQCRKTTQNSKWDVT